MYKIFTANTKTEKRLRKYLALRQDIKNKLTVWEMNPAGQTGRIGFMGDSRENGLAGLAQT